MNEWEPLDDGHETNNKGSVRKRGNVRQPNLISPARREHEKDKLSDYRDKHGDRGHGDDGLEPRIP